MSDDPFAGLDYFCNGYPSRDLPDGRVAEVVPLFYGRARLTVRRSRDGGGLDDEW